MKKFTTLFEQASKPAAVFVGRMQPFHVGHQKTIDIALRKYGRVAVVIVEGKKTSKDKKKNPFSFSERKKFIRRVYPQASKVKILKAGTAYIGDEKEPGLVGVVRKAGWEPVSIYAGEDRVDSYEKMVDKSREKINIVADFKVEQAARVTSATKVRNAIKDNDEKTFKKLVPSVLHNQYDMMRKALT